MNNFGVIYDINNDKAVILTQNSKFIMIPRREDMFLGQQITFEEKDIYWPKKNIYKYVSISASIAAVFVLIFMFFRMMPGNTDIYGYVAIDINPSVEFYINKDYEVLKAVALNEDAAKLIKNLEVKNKSIESVLIEIITQAKKAGYIKREEKTDVLISASINDVRKEDYSNEGSSALKLNRLLNEIEKDMEGHDSGIAWKILRVTSEERRAAQRYDISMGKYDLFLRAKEQEIDISIDELNAMKVSDLIEIIDNTPLSSLIPEETTKTEQTSKHNVTPITEFTPARQTQETKSSISPDTTFPHESAIKSEDKTLTMPVSIPAEASDGQFTEVDGKRSVKLRHFNEEHNISSKAIRWDFAIENTGTKTIDMKNVKVRYYFKEDVDKAINFKVYFYSVGEEKADVNGRIYNITGSNNSNRYLEVTFEKGSVSPGDTVWVFGAISREDWSEFNQEDDWSFNPEATSFSEWEKMTVYISDKLVWGIKPD